MTTGGGGRLSRGPGTAVTTGGGGRLSRGPGTAVTTGGGGGSPAERLWLEHDERLIGETRAWQHWADGVALV